jgi:hypothetical protein
MRFAWPLFLFAGWLNAQDSEGLGGDELTQQLPQAATDYPPSHSNNDLKRLLTFGATAGLPLTQAFEIAPAQFNDSVLNPSFEKCLHCAMQRTLPYNVGPTLSFRITKGLSVRVEALYSRADYNHTDSIFSNSGSNILNDRKHTVNRWEFPVLTRVSARAWRGLSPFVGVGPSVQLSRSSTPQSLSLYLVRAVPGGLRVLDALHPKDSTVLAGLASEAGVKVGKRTWSPSVGVRFTRWFGRAVDEAPFGNPASDTNPAKIRSIQNQVSLLVGFSF